MIYDKFYASATNDCGVCGDTDNETPESLGESGEDKEPAETTPELEDDATGGIE